MADRSSKISLIIGLSLPAIMVAVIAGLVFLPGQSVNPTSDFIYASGPYPSYTVRNGNAITQYDMSIKGGKLTRTATSFNSKDAYAPYPGEKNNIPRFFIHHTAKNTNEEIGLEEIEKLNLSPDKKSPDGFTLTFGRQSYGVFPFFFDNNSDREHAYLSTNRASKEVTLISDTSIIFYDFQLIGWVIKAS